MITFEQVLDRYNIEEVMSLLGEHIDEDTLRRIIEDNELMYILEEEILGELEDHDDFEDI